jgi:N-acyl-D-aspartate/D-glutamate deacylase
MTFSLVVRNGTVVDGSGADPYRADVAVEKGRIVAIGRVDEKGTREVDAEGHVVAPGFIDGHTHMDAQVLWDPLGSSSCWHGVTTVVMGNCGFTLAPGGPNVSDLVIRNIERAEDMARPVLEAGVDWTWETFDEYLSAIERRPLGINYAAYVGHSALRSWAMGERAFEEPATDADLDRMATQLEQALRAGAIGFSTSRTFAHQTRDSRPVASRLATWDEVTRLVCVMASTGRGVFELTPGPGGSGDPDNFADVYSQIYELALTSGVPFTYGLFGTGPDRLQRLTEIEEVVRAGGEIFAQTHSRGTSGVLSFRSRLPYDVLPEWQELHLLPIDEQLTVLRDPAGRERLAAAARSGAYPAPVGTEPKPPSYDRMFVLERSMPPNPTVASLAAEQGRDPVDVLMDLIIDSDGHQFFFQPFHPIDEEIKARTLRHPQTVMTFSDSGAHVSQIIDASIQTYFLAYWVRDLGAISLPEAVKKMTSVPAQIWRLRDRGLIREGFVADLTIFDPDTVAPAMPKVLWDLPAGGMRLEQRATGILSTVVGGEVLIADGQHTGAFPGQVLRSGGIYNS